MKLHSRPTATADNPMPANETPNNPCRRRLRATCAALLLGLLASTTPTLTGCKAKPTIPGTEIPDTEDNWLASLNVDLMHTVRLVRAAMPHLEASDSASIIAISSVSGRESDFASGPYGTAKTAIVGFIHGLALQLAEKGIRANTVSPGNTYFEGGVWAAIETGNPELYETAVGLNPTGHMGMPDEVADPVVFLASPRASRISGTNLVVDGALTRGIQL